MSNQTLQAKLRSLESTIAELKQTLQARPVVTMTLPNAVLEVLAKDPLTIVELSERLKTTKAIVRLAVNKLANDGQVIMVSEPGKRVARFRVFLSSDFPRRYAERYLKRTVSGIGVSYANHSEQNNHRAA